MINKKWCGFHKKMEPIDNFHKDSYASDGLKNCCKSVQIKRVERSQHKKFPYRNEYSNLRNKLKRGTISRKAYEKELLSLKLKYNVA